MYKSSTHRGTCSQFTSTENESPPQKEEANSTTKMFPSESCSHSPQWMTPWPRQCSVRILWDFFSLRDLVTLVLFKDSG